MATAEWEHSSCITMDAVADLGLLRYIKISKRLSNVKEEPEKLPSLQQRREFDPPSLSQRRLSGYFVSSESFPNVSLSRRRTSFEGGFGKGPKIVGNSCTLHAKDTMQKRKELDSDEMRRTTLPPLVTNTRKKRQTSNGCPRMLGWPRYRRGRSNRVEKPQYSFRIKSGFPTDATTTEETTVDRSLDDEKSPRVIDVSVDMLTKEKTETVTLTDKDKVTLPHVPQAVPIQRKTSLPRIEKGFTKHTVHENFSFDILPREKMPSPDLGADGPPGKTGKTPPVVQRNLHIRLPDIYERQRTIHCRNPSDFGSWQVPREEDDD
ncbi:Hypp1203 [Branchiostoma lanceolatum]|uniref:Hypp1203 protein n=1 Tax=Branchiostoma lanceolatum TaxID=7740 RepID=A0A8J9ZFD5_BRALA|nr:Hypp1203 [Branchiostoma lanceolatum]